MFLKQVCLFCFLKISLSLQMFLFLCTEATQVKCDWLLFEVKRYKTHLLATSLVTPSYCLQKYLNSLWHKFSKLLTTYLRDLGSCLHGSIPHLLQSCRPNTYNSNLPSHHIPDVLHWDGDWRSFEYRKVIATYKKPNIFFFFWCGLLSR